MQGDSEECKVVGDISKVDSLLDKYKDTPSYNDILSLANGNCKMRPIRRDGNCFYYAIIFLVLEHYSTPSLSSDLIKRLTDLNFILLDAGIEEYLINEFTDPIITVLKSFTTGETAEIEELDSVFWNYSVTYFRMLTSAYIKKHPSEFSGFIEGDIEEYCRDKIEISSQDAGEIEMTAVIKALKVSFDIIWVEDGLMKTIRQGTEEFIGTLLFLSCHFDIIYVA